MDRHRIELGTERVGRQVVVIGDTPLDVDCAKHNGCRALGVGTGPFDPTALEECGADLAVPDLTDTEAIVRWIVSPE